jgi:hypothetical protein
MNRIVMVGDPHQAIYGFRGSVGEGMSVLTEDLKAQTLPLSVTWRCPKAVVDYAKQYVPEFEAAPGAPEGSVSTLKEWDIDRDTFPYGTAVVCRNNAPLLSLAMAMISEHIPCAVRGTDIGKNLVRTATKIVKEYRCVVVSDLEKAVVLWAQREVEAKPKKADRFYERRDCIKAVLESCASIDDFFTTMKNIFSDQKSAVTLSTIHKAKGLEWNNVMFLNSFLIPSKFATTEEELQQETNLLYVGATRAKSSLSFINTQ